MKKVVEPKTLEHGQSMVELALSFTFLMILLAGTIDFGRAFLTWIQMRDAAQEGASYASICPLDGGEVKARVDDNLNHVYDYSINYYKSGTEPEDSITITVETALPITMPFLGTVLNSDSISVTATINDTILTSSCPTQ